MNKLLRFFGLITIKRARNLTASLHIHYVASVVDEVKSDFGAQPVKDFSDQAKTWWSNEFDALVAKDANDIRIDSVPKLS